MPTPLAAVQSRWAYHDDWHRSTFALHTICHDRRCPFQASCAATLRNSRSVTGSRPFSTGGRNSSASWISGARWSRFRIELGYRHEGAAGFGLRRVLVDEARNPKMPPEREEYIESRERAGRRHFWFRFSHTSR